MRRLLCNAKKRDKPAAKAIVFAPTGTTLVAEGDVVGPEAQELLNELVQARLSDLGIESQEAIRELTDKFEAEQTKALRDAEKNARTAEQRIGAEAAALEAQLRERRDEVNGIQVMQLLTEAEYWDLKERFAGVFTAGMGAEALFEIVSRMDLERLGKEPTVVGDTAGFVANRIQMAMFKEAAAVVAEGFASAEDVDRIVRGSFGFRLPFFGPFAIADMAGLDTYAGASRNPN